MWNCHSNFDYFRALPKSKIRLLNKTCRNFKIPATGVVLVFDKLNYKNYRKDSVWRNLGNYMNIQHRVRSRQRKPKIIRTLIDSKNYSHLIWLSRRAWDDTKIDFVWNLSHELRHLEQDIECRTLSMVGYFLYNNLKGMDIDEPKIPSTIPTELDTELAAWRVARQVVGKSATDAYVLKNAKLGKKQDDFCALLNCNPENYDVYRKTISFVRKYKAPLNKRINEASSYYFDALRNVDYIVSKLSRIQKSASQ